MKYILEFETLEELLIAQAKIDATKATESRKYREEIIQLEKEIARVNKKEGIATLAYHYIVKVFLIDILEQEAKIRKSMFL